MVAKVFGIVFQRFGHIGILSQWESLQVCRTFGYLGDGLRFCVESSLVRTFGSRTKWCDGCIAHGLLFFFFFYVAHLYMVES